MTKQHYPPFENKSILNKNVWDVWDDFLPYINGERFPLSELKGKILIFFVIFKICLLFISFQVHAVDWIEEEWIKIKKACLLEITEEQHYCADYPEEIECREIAYHKCLNFYVKFYGKAFVEKLNYEFSDQEKTRQ